MYKYIDILCYIYGHFKVTSYKKGLKNVFLKIWVNVLLKCINLRCGNSRKLTHY